MLKLLQDSMCFAVFGTVITVVTLLLRIFKMTRGYYGPRVFNMGRVKAVNDN